MSNDRNEFEILRAKVTSIDPRVAGSLGQVARTKAAVNKAFEEDRLPFKQWRTLIDELRLIQARTVATVRSKS